MLNEELKDVVHLIALKNGHWDFRRNYNDFCKNLNNEFEEAEDETKKGRDITKNYSNEDGKIEGLPSELADIVIFILDYFAGNNPPIKITQEWLHNDKTQLSQKSLGEIIKECKKHLTESQKLYEQYNADLTYTIDNMRKKTETLTKFSRELHRIIKNIQMFCESEEIDLLGAIDEKNRYNASRKKHYRTVGDKNILVDDNVVLLNSEQLSNSNFNTNNIVARINNDLLQIHNIKERRELSKFIGVYMEKNPSKTSYEAIVEYYSQSKETRSKQPIR